MEIWLERQKKCSQVGVELLNKEWASANQRWRNFSSSCAVVIVVVCSVYSSRELTEQTWGKNMHPLWRKTKEGCLWPVFVSLVFPMVVGQSLALLKRWWLFFVLIKKQSGVGLRTSHHSSAVTKDHVPLAKSTSPRLAIFGGCKVPVSPQRISGFWVGGKARQKSFTS